MQFLIDKGFNLSLLRDLEEKYDEAILDVVEMEEDNVIEVIDYLQEIGIKYIDSLMIYDIGLFTTDINKVKEAFEKQNIPEFVRDINDDIVNIDRL